MHANQQALEAERRWLWLGVAALALAGVFAVILVVARTPQLQGVPGVAALFPVALVIHVDLSVLFWFLAALGAQAAALTVRARPQWAWWTQAGWGCFAAAMAALALSPLSGDWQVLKSNYIPVLDTPLFHLGLALLLMAMLLVLPPALWLVSRRALSEAEKAYMLAGAVALLAVVALVATGWRMGEDPDRQQFFETLFWAGGHLLQFCFTALLVAGWFTLLRALGATPARLAVSASLGLIAAGAVASLGAALWFGPLHPVHVPLQTRVMIELGGLGLAVAAAETLRCLWRVRPARWARAYAATLVMSWIVTLAGSLLGLLIAGQNVTIPAHYHGMIVGVTLALMGAAMTRLGALGYRDAGGWRLAFWQPILYGTGQLMHIGGLGYSGGYGVLRKSAESASGLAPDVKIALGLMGLGGLLAVLGGILFVVVMLRSRLAPKA